MFDEQKLNKHRKYTEQQIEYMLDVKKEHYFLINRPCSYGKTHIIINQCKKRNGQKIIIEPTNALVDYVTKKWSRDLVMSNTQIITYSFLLHKTKEDFLQIFKNVTYIFLDEVHRAGAEKWGEFLRSLTRNFS